MNERHPRTAVIIVDYPLWLDALQILLERLDLAVVGRAVRRDDALSLVNEHRPDVIVADLGAVADEPGDDPPTSTILARARAVNPDVACIVLSDTDGRAEVERAFALGATIVCARRTPPEDLAAAIRQSFDRSIHFAATARRIAAVAPATVPADEVATLTKREREILRLAAEGYSNAQLAKMLWVTEQTVKFHLSNIYRKLGVSNRTEASRWAQRNGLLPAQSAA